ncbi:MAG: CoA transferase, partial [Actinomycetota bacterium]|nr:CoA transferase [Actinomycetota bacterium]
GADVIKLEPPQGDLLRGMIGVEEGPDPWWQLDNRGKRGVAIDLTTEDGIAAARSIVATCDVFLTNLTSERQERYRLGPDVLRRDHPELIHATITGYGSSGPDKDRLAFDHTAFFSRGGVLDIMGEPGSPPAGRAGQGDHTTALALLSAILLALRERDLTGEGQAIEVALMQIAMWTLGSDISVGLATGELPAPRMRIETPSPLVTRFRCADDRWMTFCMPGERHWPAFCDTLGKPEWVDDPRFATAEARAENAPELITLCDEVIETADRATWARRCDDAGLTWGSIQSLPDVVADPQAEAFGAFGDVDGLDRPFRTLNAPIHLRGSEARIRGRGPDHGEHTAEVLAEAGLTEAQIDELLERGVVLRHDS